MAMHLATRFFLTSEFENFDLNDVLDNKKWFDIKLLVDANRADHDHSKPMANDTCAKAVKSVLGELRLHSNHWLHLGQTVDPKQTWSRMSFGSCEIGFPQHKSRRTQQSCQ
jgi:hypothetical protein